MHDEDVQEEETPTPEQQASRAELAREEDEMYREVNEFIDMGWRWDDATNCLVDPQDNDLWLMIDPLRLKIIHSAKYWEEIEATMEEEEQSGNANICEFIITQVWTLTCRRCWRTIDFDDVHLPTQRLAEWATCCGEVMELERVMRSKANA